MRYLKVLVIGVTIFGPLSCKQNTKRQEGALPYYNSADFTPQWLSKEELESVSMHHIPAFAFINQSGDTITERTVKGKIYVTDFFFTNCPGICKKLTTNLLAVQRACKADTNVLLLSHSVTPETDSVAKLQEYAQRYGIIKNKWHLLTGNRSSIYSIARLSYFADEDMGVQQDANDFLHTENVLLIDKQRHIRGIYKGTSETEIKNLIADIKTLQLEE